MKVSAIRAAQVGQINWSLRWGGWMELAMLIYVYIYFHNKIDIYIFLNIIYEFSKRL